MQAADAAGGDVSVLDVEVTGARQGWTHLKVDGLVEDNQLVRHVAFPTPKRGVLNAFDTYFTKTAPTEGSRQVVDAETGEILLRESTVHNLADNPLWDAFPANPQLTPLGRYPWNFPSAGLRRASCGAATDVPGASSRCRNPRRPNPWDVDGHTPGTPTFTTRGDKEEEEEEEDDFAERPGTATP